MIKPASILPFAALLLAACGGSTSPATQPSAPTVQADITTATPAQAAAGAYKFGQTQQRDEENIKSAITVYGYRQPLPAQDAPTRSGYVYAGLEAKVCVESSPDIEVTISTDPWTLAFADDTIAEPYTASPGEFSVPLYPQFGKHLPVGECVRGWIVFEVPRGAKPARAVHAPTGLDGTPLKPLRWAIA